jgi:hypothetical protein
LSFYELTGYLKKVFKDDKRFMYLLEFKDEVQKQVAPYLSHKQYNCSTWVYSQPYLVTISNNYIPSRSEKLELFYLHIVNERKFKEMCKRLTKLKIEKYEGEWFK